MSLLLSIVVLLLNSCYAMLPSVYMITVVYRDLEGASMGNANMLHSQALHNSNSAAWMQHEVR